MSIQTKEARLEFLRFAIVGVVVAAVYFFLFIVLIQTRFSEFMANTIAFCIAVGLQYALQATWTFRKNTADPAQARRFLVTIGIGFCLASAISSGLGPLLNWPPAVTAFVVVVTLPISNFILFKLWVFTPD
ncbi:GtrA family protein [uncultured Aliiroseovarius sp.]|uniref:GtrA family protein n=1 Tax=uncultured Aliiroseovarius sp. TaxID=1658783 RepID=UPI002604AD0B|nr:GtrA family protein [uncultured Aliiroseovarius sp.]